MQKQVRFRARLALFITALIWGSTFFVMKEVAGVFPTPFLMAIRFSTGTMALALLFPARLPLLRQKRYLLGAVTTGVTQALAYMLQTLGLAWDTSPGKSAFLTAAYCVLVPFLAWLALRRRPSGWQFVAAGMCLTGIGLLSLNEAFGISPGDFVTLLGSIIFALNILAISHAGEMGCDPIALTIGQLAVAAAVSWGMTLALGAFPAVSPPAKSWACLVFLGLVASALCMAMQAYGQKHVEPSQASLLLSLESVFGVVFSVIFYGEVLSARLLAGFALIFCAVVVSETRLDFLFRRASKIPPEQYGQFKE
ncbi:MAG: DMT family transporter [Eubacteriales bacterium]|nr:DMT family transporter [Eubacteriales bacterium]